MTYPIPNYADVIIVGGGPAGLSAAESAAKQGINVVVLERQKEIGYPIHTSGGSWISDMVALTIPPRLYHPVNKIIFISPQNSCKFVYPIPVCCVLDVRGVYQYLAGRAVAAGAHIFPASPVEGPIITNGRVVGVKGKNSSNEPVEWQAPVTIDCSGYSSTLATRASLHEGYRRYGYGAEWDLYAPNYPQDELYLLVGSHVAPSGYAWAFPHGENRVRLGVGVIRPDVNVDARDYLLTFTERIPQLAPLFKDSSPIEYHTGLFPSEGMMRHFVMDGLMTAGDSAGHGSTLVGEGIRFAIYAGQMAGKVASESAKRGNTSASALSEFDHVWRSRFGRNLEVVLRINKHIAAYTDEQWNSGLETLKCLTPQQAADAIRGDFSVRLLTSIVRRNPSMLNKGARAFVNTLVGYFGRQHPLTEAEIAQSE
jgi:digeranylgeranylglycerophospholipid reductase